MLLISQIVIIIATFFNVIFDASYLGAGRYIGNLNIYGKVEIASLFLFCSLVEIFVLLNRNEKMFIFLRVVNSALLLNVLLSISAIIQQSEENAYDTNAIGNLMSSFTSFATFGLYNVPNNIARSSRLLFGYYLILFAFFISFIIFSLYLYRRFIKKEDFTQTSQFQFRDCIHLFAKNKLLSVATCLTLLSQFLPFNSMNDFSNPTPAFAAQPVVSSIIIVITLLQLASLLQNNRHKFKQYIIFELASVFVWNPFYVFSHLGPGVGYFLYMIGVGLLTYVLIENRLKKI